MGEVANSKFIKMTETPIPRLVLLLGIPTTISMLITNIYNMADSYFISQISLSAGGATSVVFGIMSILQAFGFMFGHGAGSKVSRLLGEKRVKEACTFATTGFFYSMMCGILISVVGLVFLEPLMKLLGSTDTILPYSMNYGMWILIAAPAMTSSCVLNNILRYEGMATLAMIGLTSGGILNIVLDPIFIFGLDMGIAGAGLATALSQYISFGILLSMFILKKTQSKLNVKYFSRRFKTIGEILIIGLPSFARQGLNSVSTMVLKAQAKMFGDVAIASMGYVTRTTGLIFSVGLGMGQGFQPVAAFNYGAKRYTRVKKATIFTMIFGAIFIGTISACCFVLAPQIMSLFGNDAQVIEIGSVALRIQCLVLGFLPISVVTTMLFQSIGKSLLALVLSCLQNGIFFLPLCLTLPHILDLFGLQIAQPIAYLLTSMVSIPMLISFLKKLPRDSN